MINKKEEIPITNPKLKEVSSSSRILTIGILKERNKDEKRVALTPYAVQTIIGTGHIVLTEKGAGLGANYSDEDYRIAGARISDRKSLIKQSDIIVKIGPLTYEEIQEIPKNKIIFSALHPNTQTKENIELLLKKYVIAIAYEYYQDHRGLNPFTYLMNEIIGSTSIMIAAELLTNTTGGKGIMLGGLTGITPSSVMVIGTDIAAEYAIRIALGLGASVKVFDDDINGLLRMEQLFGQHLFTSSLNRKALTKVLQSADVIINSKIKRHEQSYIITEDMVKLMRSGSVIIDMKIDSGSVIETSVPTTFEKPIFTKYGVIHYCVPNIPSRVSRTASMAISDVLAPILLDICKEGGIIPLIKRSESLRSGTYIFQGILMNLQLAKRFDMDAKDWNIILPLL